MESQVLPCSPPSEAAGLIERWTKLLLTQGQLGGTASPEGGIHLKSVPNIIWYNFFHN